MLFLHPGNEGVTYVEEGEATKRSIGTGLANRQNLFGKPRLNSRLDHKSRGQRCVEDSAGKPSVQNSDIRTLAVGKDLLLSRLGKFHMYVLRPSSAFPSQKILN